MPTDNGSNSPASPTISFSANNIQSGIGSKSPSRKITEAEVLDKAKEAVVDRGLNYGTPEDNFARIARYWNVHLMNRYTGYPSLDPIDVAIMMDLMKTARLDNNPHHLDSWVDKAGYSACGANIACEVKE